MAETHWNDITDLSTPAGTDTALVRRPGPQNNNRGIVYEVTLTDLFTALQQPGGGLIELASESISFTSRGAYVALGSSSLPATAKAVVVLPSHPYLPALPPVSAARLRGLTAASAGDIASEANGVPMLVNMLAGFQQRVWLGLTAGNLPLIAYEFGRTAPTTTPSTILLMYS